MPNNSPFPYVNPSGKMGKMGKMGKKNKKGKMGKGKMGYGKMGQGYGMNCNTNMNNPYAYRNGQFNNYHSKQYGITRNHIDRYSESLFYKYDRDRSGSLHMYELYPLLNEFMTVSGLGPVSQRDVEYMMYIFDADQSGEIDFFEFKMMLKQLGGHKNYNRNMILNKKHKHKNKKKKNKKSKIGKLLKGLF